MRRDWAFPLSPLALEQLPGQSGRPPPRGRLPIQCGLAAIPAGHPAKCFDRNKASPHRPLGIVLMRLRVPEIGSYPIPCTSPQTFEPADRLCDAPLGCVVVTAATISHPAQARLEGQLWHRGAFDDALPNVVQGWSGLQGLAVAVLRRCRYRETPARIVQAPGRATMPRCPSLPRLIGSAVTCFKGIFRQIAPGCEQKQSRRPRVYR
jgi:hypothetical protein